MDIGTLIAALIVLAGLYGLHHLALQEQDRKSYAAGAAAGRKERNALEYIRGSEDGLIEGRAQASRELTISIEKAYDRGYEQGQLDLLTGFSEANQVRGTGPTMSA